MEKTASRIALIGIIVENTKQTEQIQSILHNYNDYIVGRLGLPYRDKNINIISVVIDAPNNVISSLAGKLGMLEGVSSKTLYQK